MNRILFRWFPSELTSEFLRFYNHESAKVARVSLILGGIVYVGFYIWDRVIDIEHSLETLIIRLGIALMILAILLLPRNVFVRHLQEFVSAPIVTAGLAHVAILSIVKDGIGPKSASNAFTLSSTFAVTCAPALQQTQNIKMR
jgi:hypothetical protein